MRKITDTRKSTHDAEVFEAVCREFHDTYFEDRWDSLPDDGIEKAALRNSMRNALLKLWSMRPAR
jgi:hypothetical protein